MERSQNTVLDRAGSDAALAQLPEGTVSGYLPVHESTFQVWMAKGSRCLFCLGTGEVEVIDTVDKEKRQKFVLKSGHALASRARDDSSRLTLVMEKATFVWDGLTGRLIIGTSPETKAE